MEDKQILPRYPANWGIRFLCDCKKLDSAINIHKGIAHDISTVGVRILSDHCICHQKKIAMQLLIPSLVSGAPQRIVKIIGNSNVTLEKEGKFLTEVEFLHFEEDGLRVLEKNLQQRFDPRFYGQIAQQA